MSVLPDRRASARSTAPETRRPVRLKRLATPAAALLVALTGVLAAPSPAQAATVDRYEFTNVQLDDGGTATGWLETDGADQVLGFEVDVEGGDTDTYRPLTYSPGNGSIGYLGGAERDIPGFTVRAADSEGQDGAFRRLQLFGAETESPDGGRIITLDPEVSYECYNCFPLRRATGTVTITRTETVTPDLSLGPQGACTPDAAYLQGRFTDPDSAIDDVTLSAQSSNPAAVGAEIDGRSGDGTNFTLKVTPFSAGDATVTVTADDGTNEGTIDLQVAVGDGGSGVIRGGVGTDVLFGLGGNDILGGGRGRDVLCGGDGTDRLKGGAAIDSLFGGAGADRIGGNGGGDLLDGGAGGDVLRGRAGDDGLFGRGGNDRLIGGAGSDYFDGGAGRNELVDVGPGDTRG